MVFVRNKVSHQMMLKITMQEKGMGQTQQVLIVTYNQSLSADCDFDLSGRNMVLAIDKLPCYENYLMPNNFQITSSTGQSSELDMKMFSLCTKFAA